MKKSILNVALLSMLFVLGACSTEDKGDDKAAALAAANVGLEDALTQVGAVTGFDKWSMSASDTIEGTTFAVVENLFIKGTEFKEISANVVNGSVQIDEAGTTVTYNNEVTWKTAAIGTFSTTTPFSLESVVRDDKGDIISTTPVLPADLAGYTELYTLTSTKQESWESDKVGGAGAWVPEEYMGTSTYIVKKIGTTLSMIRVSSTSVDNTYSVEGTMTEAIARAVNYTK